MDGRGKVRMLAAASAAGVVGALAVPVAASAAAAPSGVTVVAKGFADPFGIAVRGGAVYATETISGKVTKVDLGSGARSTVVAGLPGVVGVDVGSGAVWAVTGESGSPKASKLYRIRGGKVSVAADLKAYELKHNPDGQSQKARDSLSNPFGVLRLSNRTLVADAGANDVISVGDNGKLSTFFAPRNITTGKCKGARNNDPQHPGCDPTPTGVALGADGFIYVSGLGGETPGAGRIWKLNAQTGKVVRSWVGFTALTGVAAGPDGSVYASQLLYGAPEGNPGPGFDPSTVGRIVRVAPNGTRTFAHVSWPLGLSISNGQLYSSAWSVATAFLKMPKGSGQVVRVSASAFK